MKEAEEDVKPGDSVSATGDADERNEEDAKEGSSATGSATGSVVHKPKRREPWTGEAWSVDDGLVLNMPLFKGCGIEFKRLLLRAIREWEYHDAGKETWYDPDYDEICTLEKLPKDRLPPLHKPFIGMKLDPGEYIARGGDYDDKLVVIIRGTVEKLVGDAPQGGQCIVRTLKRGDCEGITEFLGVGSEQRTCALRAGPEGARVRFVQRQALTELLLEKVIDENAVQPEDPDDPRIMRLKWAHEVAYFNELSLDRIDSLNHKEARNLLTWNPGPVDGPDKPLDFLQIPGQSVFMVDNALGTSVSGPLPEGIEERYYFDKQTILRPGVPGDCAILILRGQVEALVPEGCAGNCLPRAWEADEEDAMKSWLGDGRDGRAGDNTVMPVAKLAPKAPQQELDADREKVRKYLAELGDKTAEQEVAMVSLVLPQNIKRAMAHLRKAAEDGLLDLSSMKTSDWRWLWGDRQVLVVFDTLERARLLSSYGLEVRLFLNPPEEEPPPEPQAVLGPGMQLGRLALLGVPIVLSGVVRAKGPVLVAILHRSVLLQALGNCAEVELFMPQGLTIHDRLEVLKALPSTKNEVKDRPSHLGPITGPPAHKDRGDQAEAAAGTFAAFAEPSGRYRQVPGADAFEHVLMSALKSYSVIWDLVHDAPPRLLDQLVRAWEPRWLLPGETIVADEEPEADFVFVLVHGSCVVLLEDREIENVGQGSVQGAAQLLALNGWTRTVQVAPTCNGEAMIQVMTRQKLLDMLDGHPLPKARLRALEQSLQEGKEADWRILKNIPAFGSCAYQPFLTRLHKDADIRLFCAGDMVAFAGDDSAAMMVVLAGKVRCEQPQTLFFVELHRGEWCYQDNILGNTPTFGHDAVAVTNVLVLVLYRHAMQNAMVAYPDTRKVVIANETWRKQTNCPDPSALSVFAKLPAPLLSDVVEEARPVYYRPCSLLYSPGEIIDDNSMLFVLRGELSLTIMGIEVRRIGAGGHVGLHHFMELQCPAPNVTIRSTQACDCLLLQQSTIQKALDDELMEDDMLPYTASVRVLEGGEILDAFGFPVGDGSAKNVPDCVEQSEVFRACSKSFVAQIAEIVEDLAFWPGEKIYQQYEEGHFMYFVRAGRIRLEVLGRREPEIVEAGTTLGDMAVLDQVPHYVESAYAETHVWVRVLHKKLLRRSLSSFPEEERSMLGQVHAANPGIFG
ncbi:unnamed protein product [Effrenium voratum]|uniref:Cyclic nucleotide-binding domain-containing protein n=1 Tax=Effrenium voratum TaxID=2562239 RepID=A0AA36HME3_9DINO|nr:unnamed protein product [Effrenium voratum]